MLTVVVGDKTIDFLLRNKLLRPYVSSHQSFDFVEYVGAIFGLFEVRLLVMRYLK